MTEKLLLFKILCLGNIFSKMKEYYLLLQGKQTAKLCVANDLISGENLNFGKFLSTIMSTIAS